MSVQLKSEIKGVGYQVLREALLPVGLSFLVSGFNRTGAEIAQLTLYSRMRKKIEKKFATYVDQSGERADGFSPHQNWTAARRCGACGFRDSRMLLLSCPNVSSP